MAQAGRSAQLGTSRRLPARLSTLRLVFDIPGKEQALRPPGSGAGGLWAQRALQLGACSIGRYTHQMFIHRFPLWDSPPAQALRLSDTGVLARLLLVWRYLD